MLPTELHDAALHPRPPLAELRRLAAIHGRSVRKSIGLPVSGAQSVATPEIVYQSQLRLRDRHYDVVLNGQDMDQRLRVMTSDSDQHPWMTAGLRQIASDLPGTGTALPDPVEPDRLATATREVTDARCLLADVDRYSLAAFESLVRRVVVVYSDQLKSATQMPTFGTVYLESGMVSDPIELPLALVHETTHHCVGLQTLFVQLLVDPDQTTSHPLRPDPRPVFATVHATVVLLRMCQLARTVGPDDRAWQQRHHELQTMLAQSMRCLTEAAVWTDDGHRYHRRLEGLVDQELS